MKLSTKARYAITAMMELALNQDTKPVTLADISEYQKISLSYLEQLFAKLRSRELVRGVRGPGGGYYLAKPATEISIADIVVAINDNGESKPTGAPVGASEQQVLEGMWNNLSAKIHVFLEGISLQELVDEQSSAAASGEPMKADNPSKAMSY